jgi:glycosyltransferase involved in cell wall biosynthesis
MTRQPLVSVVTPTWQRHQLLLDRCIPSVAAQTYPHVEHVVVSDGPDPDLGKLLTDLDVVYVEVGIHHDHPDNWGNAARNCGADLAAGDLVAYLDDDNAYRPDHLARLVAAMAERPDADFAYSQMRTHPHGQVIGSAPPSYGNLDSSVLIHRRGVPQRLGSWPSPAEMPLFSHDPHAPDWAAVNRWLGNGARWVFVPAVTVDYYFAAGR